MGFVVLFLCLRAFVRACERPFVRACVRACVPSAECRVPSSLGPVHTCVRAAVCACCCVRVLLAAASKPAVAACCLLLAAAACCLLACLLAAACLLACCCRVCMPRMSHVHVPCRVRACYAPPPRPHASAAGRPTFPSCICPPVARVNGGGKGGTNLSWGNESFPRKRIFPRGVSRGHITSRGRELN